MRHPQNPHQAWPSPNYSRSTASIIISDHSGNVLKKYENLKADTNYHFDGLKMVEISKEQLTPEKAYNVLDQYNRAFPMIAQHIERMKNNVLVAGSMVDDDEIERRPMHLSSYEIAKGWWMPVVFSVKSRDGYDVFNVVYRGEMFIVAVSPGDHDRFAVAERVLRVAESTPRPSRELATETWPDEMHQVPRRETV
jgi:hypothetical protein